MSKSKIVLNLTNRESDAIYSSLEAALDCMENPRLAVVYKRVIKKIDCAEDKKRQQNGVKDE